MKLLKTMKNRGFTIVEVMTSMAYAAVIMTSLALMLNSGFFVSTNNRDLSYSQNAMREQLETLRRTSFDTIVALPASSTFTNAQLTKLPSGVGTMAVASGFDTTNIKKITLSVSWSSRRGQTLTSQMTTYISRQGINGA